ncbi:hypothetical protein AVEN_217223-1 [Araneus ventricosus]|uniref:Uncharacterized protein n=1 Tax=Araneus ventricosus TaxID=182803 RepID=A0A4Y2QFU9_ARAVE|nr:hypothetical protein AVEN_217223-1 [Araneus ventricosus]
MKGQKKTAIFRAPFALAKPLMTAEQVAIRRAINHLCACELRSDWRNQGGEWRVLALKRGNPPCVGVGVSLEEEEIEAAVVRFGASVNDPPKSIDLNGWNINQSFCQMEWIGLLVNVQHHIQLVLKSKRSNWTAGL